MSGLNGGYYSQQHHGDSIQTLRANAETDGDSVHRGMILGLLLAAGRADLPEEWKTGLKNHDELAEEIHQFAAIASRGDGHLLL